MDERQQQLDEPNSVRPLDDDAVVIRFEEEERRMERGTKNISRL